MNLKKNLMTQNSLNNIDKILLLCKKPGLTSFGSLGQVKKAIHSTKVGHTGILDSFASGLLVVCCGRLTKLSSLITGFNKTYEAVIEFGKETDTLEYTGKITKEGKLPTLENLKKSIEKWTGTVDQVPPAFSAIHIDGKRASGLARDGQSVVLPSRKITVFSADILETVIENDFVKYARISFTVSKGTYIRSLARDIAESAGSCAHLVGLYRKSVGSFKVEDSVFFNDSESFTIKSALDDRSLYFEIENSSINNAKQPKERKPFDPKDLEAICSSLIPFTPELALECGMQVLYLKDLAALEDFFHGKPLKSKNFITSLHELPLSCDAAVFTLEKDFAGVISKNDVGKLSYSFVLN